MVSSTISVLGLSCRLRGAAVTLSTKSWPSTTSPQMVWLPVSHRVGATPINNCDPSVLGPHFATAIVAGWWAVKSLLGAVYRVYSVGVVARVDGRDQTKKSGPWSTGRM